jgi:hypothetical protein|tara:strand:- start:749 stop:919 length:171 start_codon:yes stop_codon:yes gene_type:complete
MERVVDQIDLLAEIYRNFITDEGLPSVSADEQDLNQLTESQVIWIESFQTLWEAAQ